MTNPTAQILEALNKCREYQICDEIDKIVLPALAAMRGMALVPTEPKQEMIMAALALKPDKYGGAPFPETIYTAMIASYVNKEEGI